MKSSLVSRLIYVYCYFLQVKSNKQVIYSILFCSIYICLIFYVLKKSISVDFITWTAIVISPYIINADKNKKGNIKFFLLSLFFLLLAFITKVYTCFFLSVGLAILFAIESSFGRVNYLPLFLLMLISPVFKFFNSIFSFPIRLKLSEYTGNLIQLLGKDIQVNGNIIIMNGSEFSVDPVCIGLKMMAVSLLTGILLLAYFQRLKLRSFTFLEISGFMIVIIGLNIIANFFRIILITLFVVFPENPAHEVLGIMCFILYIIIPSFLIIKWYSGKNKKSNRVQILKAQKNRKFLILNILLLTVLLFAGITRFNINKNDSDNYLNICLPGYSREIINRDIIKLEKPGILLYIKPIKGFYCAEHNPMICWTGSGYEFKQVNTQNINNKKIYTGTLKKDKSKIFSAWWFDNGSNYKTINQFNWRWRALKGESFYLVNVNAQNMTLLKKEINELFETGIISK